VAIEQLRARPGTPRKEETLRRNEEDIDGPEAECGSLMIGGGRRPAPSGSSPRARRAQALPFKHIVLAFGLIPRDAVTFLDLPNKLVLFALRDIQIIVGEPAPLFLQLSFKLLPVAFNAIFVHF
jgi:hypothetical protein